MLNVDTPNVLHTLRTRHGDGAPYTNVGQKGILISINPYRWVPGLYDVEKMHEHYSNFAVGESAHAPRAPGSRASAPPLLTRAPSALARRAAAAHLLDHLGRVQDALQQEPEPVAGDERRERLR